MNPPDHGALPSYRHRRDSVDKTGLTWKGISGSVALDEPRYHCSLNKHRRQRQKLLRGLGRVANDECPRSSTQHGNLMYRAHHSWTFWQPQGCGLNFETCRITFPTYPALSVGLGGFDTSRMRQELCKG